VSLRLTLTTLTLLLSAVHACAFPSGRPSLNLDGVWRFRHVADDAGEAEWRGGAAFGRSVRVPGCWDAQGVGQPAERMRTHGLGVGWYRRTVSVPAGFSRGRVWLCVGGVHRSARFWVNGRPAGEHWGYPVAFRADVTDLLRPGAEQEVVIAVDSRRHKERDPLAGAFDLMDYMDVDWGGIFGHVTLETTGEGRLESIFVRPDPAGRRARVDVETSGAVPPDAVLECVVRGSGAAAWRTRASAGTRATLDLRLPGAPLWTTYSPKLLTAEVTLTSGAATLDRRTIRFGLRRLEVRGGEFLLNGDKLFLHGYGDDWTFPTTVTGPTTLPEWRAYLQTRKDYGFNAVRHHSTMPPEEYLDAADEVGILVQPELPVVYEPFFAAATPAGHDLYRAVWSGYIRQMRNHASVLAWCMGNEQYNGTVLSAELYRTARGLDPTRPVVDTDGVPPGARRPTLDYLSTQFEEWAIPWGSKIGKYRTPSPPPAPLVVHEMSNLSVLPNPADVPLYAGGVRPTWLEAMQSAVHRRGLAAELPAMRRASARLQASQLKLNIEAARLNPHIKGHHQWLFRDYWSQSTGFVDQFDRPRALTPELSRRFIGPGVLLWDRDRAAYGSGEGVPVRLYLSDYRPASAGKLGALTARLGAQAITLKPPARVGGRGVIGPWTGLARAPRASVPLKLTLAARCGALVNEWPIWVYPAPAPGKASDVLVVRSLTPNTLDELERGRSVLVTDDGATFPTLQARFKTAWWHGDDAADHTYGNQVADHPAVRGFAPEGYGDLQAANMMEDRPVVMLDDVPGGIRPIIACLDVPWRMARKAYLFEARVGRGKLLVSTLNLSRTARAADPAAAWLRARLEAYAAGDAFRPAAEIPVEWLRKRVTETGLPDPADWSEGFGAVVASTAKAEPWHTHRDDMAPTYPVRQSDGAQSLRWRTAPVRPKPGSDTVTLVWAGGIGWSTEPEAGGFTLTVNGRHAVEFPFTVTGGQWSSADGTVRLRYTVRRTIAPDSFGLFFLTAPVGLFEPGRPAEIEVRAPGNGSKRWFALAPYRDAASREAEP
jgi:hypothetical protein